MHINNRQLDISSTTHVLHLKNTDLYNSVNSSSFDNLKVFHEIIDSWEKVATGMLSSNDKIFVTESILRSKVHRYFYDLGAPSNTPKKNIKICSQLTDLLHKCSHFELDIYIEGLV